jgi:hypothetical protein
MGWDETKRQKITKNQPNSKLFKNSKAHHHQLTNPAKSVKLSKYEYY